MSRQATADMFLEHLFLFGRCSWAFKWRILIAFFMSLSLDVPQDVICVVVKDTFMTEEPITKLCAQETVNRTPPVVASRRRG